MISVDIELDLSQTSINEASSIQRGRWSPRRQYVRSTLSLICQHWFRSFGSDLDMSIMNGSNCRLNKSRHKVWQMPPKTAISSIFLSLDLNVPNSQIYGLDLWLHKCWKKTIPLNDNCNWLKQIKSPRERNWISCLTFYQVSNKRKFSTFFSVLLELSVLYWMTLLV